jgi:L-ribulose-5-phosphate 4-epimerase
MTPDDAKQKLITAGLILEGAGQGDMTRGHVSVRVPGDPSRFYMKPHSFGFDEITMDNIVTCDMEGKKVEGWAPRHSEIFIHTEIYKARPDITSIIHSHPDHAVAVSATGRPLRMLSQPSAAFADGVGYYTDTIDLIRRPDQGAGVAKAFGSHKAAFLKNHGVVVGGSTLEEAVILTIMLENACRIQILAESAGDLAPEFPREDILELYDKLSRPEQHAVNFNYLARRARRQK